MAGTPEKKTLVPNGGYPMHTYEDLKELYYTYISDPLDRKMIEAAYLYAKEKHKDELPEIGRALYSASARSRLYFGPAPKGPATIAAGLLHDTVEDTDATIEDITPALAKTSPRSSIPSPRSSA
jgi:(p)ppGpp synthase/HD superfamily hydrolase